VIKLKTIGTRILATTLAAVVVVGTGGATYAATVGQTDPAGDAPARYDVSRATYVNEGEVVRGVVKVPGIRRSVGNQFQLRVRPDRTDSTYLLVAKRYAGGRTSTRLVYINVVGQRYTLPCTVRASWDFANDRVSVWTRSRGYQCLTEKGAAYFDAHVGLPNRSAADHTATTRVRRN
jgi:hypothetical protein